MKTRSMPLHNEGTMSVDAGCASPNEPGRPSTCRVMPGLACVVLATMGLAGSADSQVVDNFNPGADGTVFNLVVQTDGKIVVGGYFRTLDGQGHAYLGRLNPNGTGERAFDPSPDLQVNALALQPNGQLLVGGAFTSLGGRGCNYLGRLNSDGSLDTTFSPGADAEVRCLAVQPDGKILVGGFIANLAGQPRAYLGRLNPDGSLDTNFNPRADGEVRCLAVQPDAKILVGGFFNMLGGQSRSHIARLQPDGSLDADFRPVADLAVTCLVIQPDRKILLGGWFETLDGQPRNHLGRLLPEGSLDVEFNAGLDPAAHLSALPYEVALQTDGKILVGGDFSLLSGESCPGLGRLNPEGTFDSTFKPAASPGVFSVAPLPDGTILVAGAFSSLGGQARQNLARLTNSEPASQSLVFTNSTISWRRGGTSPEISWATFESSTNAVDWVDLGVPRRVAGEWQLDQIQVPTNALIRARGQVPGGGDRSSSWFVESVWGPPGIISQPSDLTQDPGSEAEFSVTVLGTPPLGYEWHAEGAALEEGASTIGVHTPTLRLENVSRESIGAYWVAISNSCGFVSSQVARLAVRDPFIQQAPVGETVNPGQDVTLTGIAVGTVPMTYQWRKDGTNLVDGTNNWLTLPSVRAADVGSYSVLVSNASGTVTSTPAFLGLNLVAADTFHPEVGYGRFALQPDGKLLVFSGAFARITADGIPDTSFTLDHPIDGLLGVQSDSKVLVTSTLLYEGGWGQYQFQRINPDGTVDTSFSQGGFGGTWDDVMRVGVFSIGIQPDGKILVAGRYPIVGGYGGRWGIARIGPKGLIDDTFFAHPNNGESVNVVALQADGRILVASNFDNWDWKNRAYLARLNPDGSVDTSFNPALDGEVSCMLAQPDGKLLLAGGFTKLTGKARPYFGRLNPDGTLDAGFDPGIDSRVIAMALQVDGKIVIGGDFTHLHGQTRNHIARVNSDGTPDATFNPGASASVDCLALQPDGKILVGGTFTALAGQPRNYLGRLTNTEVATDKLACDGSSIAWSRGGTAPEVAYAFFDVSADGTNWVSLGAGTRVEAGWILSGVSVETNSIIRARGLVSATGPCWFVERAARVESQGASGLSITAVTMDRRSNQFSFNLAGAPGRSAVVEVSTNLLDWTAVSTNTLGVAPVVFVDSNSLTSFRFYRAGLK